MVFNIFNNKEKRDQKLLRKRQRLKDQQTKLTKKQLNIEKKINISGIKTPAIGRPKVLSDEQKLFNKKNVYNRLKKIRNQELIDKVDTCCQFAGSKSKYLGSPDLSSAKMKISLFDHILDNILTYKNSFTAANINQPSGRFEEPQLELDFNASIVGF